MKLSSSKQKELIGILMNAIPGLKWLPGFVKKWVLGLVIEKSLELLGKWLPSRIVDAALRHGVAIEGGLSREEQKALAETLNEEVNIPLLDENTEHEVFIALIGVIVEVASIEEASLNGDMSAVK